MSNIIENNIPTVYLLAKDQTVYVHLDGDGSLVKAENKVVRCEGSDKLAKTSKTFTVADKFNKILNPSAVENAVNIHTVFGDDKGEFFNDDETLIINVHQGEQCVLGFLDKNNENLIGGYMLSTYPEPVSHSDRGFWENTLSPAQTQVLSEKYGQTDLMAVSQYFETSKIDSITTTALQSFDK